MGYKTVRRFSLIVLALLALGLMPLANEGENTSLSTDLPTSFDLVDNPGLRQGMDQTGETYVLGITLPETAHESATPEVAIWSERISYPDASYISIHFTDFYMPPGAYMVIRDDNDKQRWVYQGNGRRNNPTFWTSHIMGEAAVLEVFAPAGTSGMRGKTDMFAAGYDRASYVSPEALCGATDWENATCFSPSSQFTKSHAVVRLRINGSGACTGWMVGTDGSMFTNEHCITTNNDATSTDYEFDAYEAGCNDSNPTWWGGDTGPFWGGSVTFVGDQANEDYAWVRLGPDGGSLPHETNAPSTGQPYGYFQLYNQAATDGQRIWIPQHPVGVSRVIAMDDGNYGGGGNCQIDLGLGTGSSCYASDIKYTCDTDGGSSGSPVVDYATNKVLALHHCGGGCSGNNGVPITDVIASIDSGDIAGETGPPPGSTQDEPSLSYSSNSIDDSAGNNDSIVDPGEAINMPVTLANGGSAGATGISAVLSTGTAGITITDNSASWSNIGAGGSRLSASPHFSYNVGAGVVCGTVINFDLAITASEGNYNSSFSVNVGDPQSTSNNYPSGNLNISIPDNGRTGSPALGTVSVGDSLTIGDVLVAVNITHTYIGDLSVYLESPGGTSVQLHNRSGAGADNIYTSYDDATSSAGNMDNFNGEDSAGTWTLRAEDHASADTGTIDNFTLTISTAQNWTCNGGGCTDPAAPAAPTVSDDCGGLVVSWAAAADADTYNVWRRSGGCGNNAWSQVATGVATTSWTDTSITLGNSAGYYIEAVNACNTVTNGKNSCGSGTHSLNGPTVDVTPNGLSSTCAGNNLNFSAGVSGGSGSYSYQWFEDGGSMAGETGSTLAVSYGTAQSHTYNVEVTDLGGCSGTFTDASDVTGTWTGITVDVTPNGTSSTCFGNTLNFSSSVTGGSGSYTYQWTEDGIDMSGETGTSLAVSYGSVQSHTYNVKVIDTGSGCSTPVLDSANATGDWIDCQPSIVFFDASSFTELTGDGDAWYEPGEKWSVDVRLANNGTANATNVTAALTDTNGGLSEVCSVGTFGNIAMGGSPSAAFTFEFVIDPAWTGSFACGTDLGFDIVTKTSSEITPAGTNEGDVFSQTVGENASGGVPATTTYNHSVPTTITKDATTNFAINVATSGSLTDVSVDVNMTPPNGGNSPTMTVTLISPVGTSGAIYSGSVAGWSNGTFPFSATFDGEDTAGDWTLRVVHSRGGGAPGGVTDGSLTLYDLDLTAGSPPSWDCSQVSAGNCAGIVAPAALANDPGAGGLTWTNKDQLNWAAVTDADTYNIYRGTGAQAPDLVNGTNDSCLKWTGSPLSTGATLSDTPAPGTFWWYIGRAENTGGEGPAGDSTAGPRDQSSTGTCP